MYKIELRNITKSYGGNPPVIENLNLGIKEGSFTVLLGPSGCGKSTILRMIAGLETVTQGDIFMDGISVRDTAPGDRQIAMVFQNYALYPTMTVRENMEFGLKNSKIPKEERDKRIQEISEMVGLTEYLDRKPQHLSGGQRQRVALARAIVKKPAVFLMDEPLSNLDAKLRNQIRTDLIELYRKLGTTFVYVTHDQVEAMSMGTDIVLLEKGVIRQSTTPNEIYQHPANVFTAKFIGSPPMNVLDASAFTELGVSLPEGTRYVGFRPEIAMVASSITGLTGDYVTMEGDLLAREMLGDQTLYKVQTPYGIVYVKIFDDWGVGYGKVTIVVKKSNLFFFDQQEQAIA